MSRPEPVAEVVQLPPRRSAPAALLVALRPRQWTKNLLLFAGIVFAAEVRGPRTLGPRVDGVRGLLRRVERGVPPQRPARPPLRPAPSGSSAAGRSPAASSRRGPRWWPRRFSGRSRSAWPRRSRLTALAFLAAFVALQGLYTLSLKHIVLIDVMAISALFVVRAAAGADAVDVRISPWLLVCTALLALFLALGKRRGELVLVGADEAPGRPVLEGYSLALVDQLVTIVAAATVLSYTVYALTAHETQLLAARSRSSCSASSATSCCCTAPGEARSRRTSSSRTCRSSPRSRSGRSRAERSWS